MDKRNTGLIATIATAVLCGCPGLFGLCMGSMFAIVGAIPGSDIDIGGSSDPAAAIGTGIAMLCVSLIFIAIPVAVGFFTLRVKPDDDDAAPAVIDAEPSPEPAKPAEPVDDEPLPPAS
jgi:hypothetical protein